MVGREAGKLSAQSLAAFALAHEVKYGRSALLAHVKRARPRDESRRLLAELVEMDPPHEYLASMRLDALLRCVYRISDTNAWRMIREAAPLRPLATDARLRDLTDRERAALAEALRSMVLPS